MRTLFSKKCVRQFHQNILNCSQEQKIAFHLLFCQARVEVTSCFVYKFMGLSFHDRINTQQVYRIAVAQVVTRRITKPKTTFFRFEYHWLLFFIHFFLGGGGKGWRSDFIILFMSYLFFFLFIYLFLFFIFYPFNMYKVHI